MLGEFSPRKYPTRMRAASDPDGLECSIWRIMANLGDGCASLDAKMKDMPRFDVQIKMGGENDTSAMSVQSRTSPRCQLELHRLRNNGQPSADRTDWENLLDAICRARANPERAASDVRIKSLDAFVVGRDCSMEDVRHSNWLSVCVDDSPPPWPYWNPPSSARLTGRPALAVIRQHLTSCSRRLDS
jgi:hypothetical protein